MGVENCAHPADLAGVIMRIVAGAFRGRRLQTPKGDRIRPTGDRVREAVFSIIAARVPGARVLDLYAGAGALGLEALSRGASGVVFVDRNRDAVRLIRANIELCGVQERAKVIHGPVRQALKRLSEAGDTFDLIFMDPPYGKGLIEDALEVLMDVARDDGALVIAEHHTKEAVPSLVGGWLKKEVRRYGDTSISFFVGNIPVEEMS